MIFEFMKRSKYDYAYLKFIDIRVCGFGFWWFREGRDWFVYFKFGKQHYRFSSAGYMKFTTRQ